jgi:hypothetical protein
VRLRVLVVEVLEAFLEGVIAGAIFEDGERLGCRQAIGSQEADAVAVACGVDTDADAVQRRYRGHGGSP